MSARPQPIRVTLRQTITGKDPSDPLSTIFQNVDTIRRAVSQLRDNYLDLERVRDQFLIHLQQYREDRDILRRIYGDLKLRLELRTNATSAQPPPPPPPMAQTVTSRRMPTLENINLSPSIQPSSARYENFVRLRYALNTSSVVCSVQYSPDGSRIAFADGDFGYIISSTDGEIINTITLAVSGTGPRHTRALKWSPDGQRIALSGANNEVRLYNVETTECIHVYHGHQEEVTSLVFNEDGSWLVSAGLDGLIFVWDTKTHTQVMRLEHEQEGNDGAIMSLSTSPDTSFYAVGFANGVVGIYGPNFDQPMTRFTAHDHKLMGLSVSPLDETIATGSCDNSVKIWVLRGTAIRKHILQGHSDVVVSLCFARDSELLVTGSRDQTIRLWQYKDGQPICTISAQRNTLFEIDHHPSQRSFVSCSGAGVVCVWDYNELGQ